MASLALSLRTLNQASRRPSLSLGRSHLRSRRNTGPTGSTHKKSMSTAGGKKEREVDGCCLWRYVVSIGPLWWRKRCSHSHLQSWILGNDWKGKIPGTSVRSDSPPQGSPWEIGQEHAPWMPPWGGVTGMSCREEAPKKDPWCGGEMVQPTMQKWKEVFRSNAKSMTRLQDNQETGGCRKTGEAN